MSIFDFNALQCLAALVEKGGLVSFLKIDKESGT